METHLLISTYEAAMEHFIHSFINSSIHPSLARKIAKFSSGIDSISRLYFLGIFTRICIAVAGWVPDLYIKRSWLGSGYVYHRLARYMLRLELFIHRTPLAATWRRAGPFGTRQEIVSFLIMLAKIFRRRSFISRKTNVGPDVVAQETHSSN